jgi:4-hydroxy-2-oxoheptanedioate aldolase
MTEATAISDLSRRLLAGETLFIGWSGVADPLVAEMLVREGLDACLFDMQHGAIDISTAISGIAALAAAGKPALVRIPVGDFALASRMLDAGAAAIVAPMINSAADARKFVSFTKYPPTGERSWGPYRAAPFSGLAAQDYLAAANGIHLAIAMIETREALDALDDILAVPGVDGVLVGPSDLSIALTEGAVVNPSSPLVEAELDRIVERSNAHGKVPCVFCSDGPGARRLAARGFRLLSPGSDLMLLRAATRAAVSSVK